MTNRAKGNDYTGRVCMCVCVCLAAQCTPTQRVGTIVHSEWQDEMAPIVNIHEHTA